MSVLLPTKEKQQLAMATTIRSFPASTTTQHDVDAWQAGRGEHLALPCHNQNLKLTATRSQVKHESTHRRDSHGSTRLHTPREGCITCLLYLSQPAVTTSQGARRPSLFRTWKRLRSLVRPMHSLPRGPFTIKKKIILSASSSQAGHDHHRIQLSPARFALKIWSASPRSVFSLVSTPTRSHLLHS